MNNNIEFKDNKIVKYAIFIELITIVSVGVLLFISRINDMSILEVIFNLLTNNNK